MKTTLFELNEKYKDYPVISKDYIINGKQYRVHSHFIGSKDINKVISDLALSRALREMLTANTA